MSNSISRRDFLKGTLSGAVSVAAMGMLAGAASAENAAVPAVYTPGTYTSIQKSAFATVEVSCTFSESALTDVSYNVLRTSESDYFTPFANPLKKYCESIVANGKAEGVDGVTGASISSAAIKDGVNDCTVQALGLELPVKQPVNPQNEDFDSFDGKLDEVFSPIKLGSMTLPNRVIKSAGSAPWADANGDKIPVCTELFGTMAENGVSLNIFAGGVLSGKLLSPADVAKEGDVDAALESLKPLLDRIHNAGGKVGYQLCYGGGAPTVPDSMINDVTVDDLKAFIDTVGISAERGKKAGFDCIEIKGASADGLNGFLTRRVNKREDEYGAQNTENRTRLFCETIRKIKEVNGEDFPVGALINGVEENDVLLGDNDLFTTIEEGKEIAKALVAAGADWIQLRVGANGQEMNIWAPDVQHIAVGANGITGYGTQFDYSTHFDGVVDGSRSGFASFFPMVKAIKEVVDVPVGCAAYNDLRLGPDFINEAIKRGELDLVFMNRPLNCDPELVKKLQEGRREDVRPCMHCMHCHDNIGSNKRYPSACRMNAASYNALTDALPEGMTPLPAETKKKVMVIGAGPAGMEAARVAAERGHSVSIYDSADKLGGLLHFARGVKGNHERFDDYLVYIAHQLEKNGVEVNLLSKVNADKVKEIAPDAVVVAVGGLRESKFSGENVFSPDAAFGSKKLGDNVVILGASVQAIDFAAYLINKGKKVTVVNPSSVLDADKGQSGWFRTYMLPYLYANGVKIWNNAVPESVDASSVTITTSTGNTKVIDCDSVVEFYDMLPNTALVSEIEKLGIEVYAVGDCAEPFNIQRAVKSGNFTARKI